MWKYLNQIGFFTILGAVACTVIAIMNEFTDNSPLDITFVTSGLVFFLGLGILIPAAYRWDYARDKQARQEADQGMLLGMLCILAAACLLASYSILWAALIGLPLLVGAIVWHGKRQPFSDYVTGQEFGAISPAVFLGFAAHMAGPEGSAWTFSQQMVAVCVLIAFGAGIVWVFCSDDAEFV